MLGIIIITITIITCNIIIIICNIMSSSNIELLVPRYSYHHQQHHQHHQQQHHQQHNTQTNTMVYSMSISAASHKHNTRSHHTSKQPSYKAASDADSEHIKSLKGPALMACSPYTLRLPHYPPPPTSMFYHPHIMNNHIALMLGCCGGC